MPISHVLAVVPVTDIEASRRWYTALFDRSADNNPMPSLVEWQVLPGPGCRCSPTRPPRARPT